jgi:lysophospholipase L1-like esterase
MRAHNGLNPDDTPQLKLLILGDSISLGASEIRGSEVVSRVATSYVELLRDAFPQLKIIVDADTHRTTTLGVKAIDALLASHRPDVVLVLLGGNDGDIDWRRFVLSNGTVIRSRTTVETYEQNLRQLAGKILAAGATPMLADMPNQHLELRGPYISSLAGKDVCEMIERSGGQAVNDAERARYLHCAQRLADELSIPLARYGQEMDRHPGREMVGIDGAHPSDAGHRVIFHALQPILRQLLQQPARQLAGGLRS